MADLAATHEDHPLTDRVYASQFHATPGAEAWRVLPEGACAAFRTDSFAASIRFVDAIATQATDTLAPNLDVRPDGVTVLLRSFKESGYGMTTDELSSHARSRPSRSSTAFGRIRRPSRAC